MGSCVGGLQDKFLGEGVTSGVTSPPLPRPFMKNSAFFCRSTGRKKSSDLCVLQDGPPPLVHHRAAMRSRKRSFQAFQAAGEKKIKSNDPPGVW